MTRIALLPAAMIAGVTVAAAVFADNFKAEVPKEATGFKGVLVGKVVEIKPPDKWSTSGWITINEIRVLSFSQAFKVSAADLTAAWKGIYSTIGAKDGTVKAPENLKVGDFLTAECFQNEGHLRATKLFAYKAGEDEPNCYAFVRKEQKGNKVTVTLKKITEEKTATLALEKAPGDTMVPRADLLKTLDGMESGAVIIVELDHNTLKGIKPYESPKKGQFVKTAGQKSGDKFLPSVQIKDDAGAERTIALLPRNATELSREAHNLKAGAAVFYRTETDDKGTWLTAIWPEP